MVGTGITFGRQLPAMLLGKSGLISSGHGIAHSDIGPGTIVLAMIIGGVVGLVGGIFLGQLIRYIAYLFGRHVGGPWPIVGALLGAIIFTWITVAGSSK